MPIRDHDFEWLKMLVSTLAGLFAGLIAEPFRSTLQRKIEIVRLDRAIGFDCLRTVMYIESMKHGLIEDAGALWKVDILPAYSDYWQNKRELFYGSFDLQHICTICMHIQQIRQNVLDQRADPARAIAETEILVHQILDRHKDKKKLRERIRRFWIRFIT